MIHKFILLGQWKAVRSVLMWTIYEGQCWQFDYVPKINSLSNNSDIDAGTTGNGGNLTIETTRLNVWCCVNFWTG